MVYGYKVEKSLSLLQDEILENQQYCKKLYIFLWKALKSFSSATSRTSIWSPQKTQEHYLIINQELERKLAV